MENANENVIVPVTPGVEKKTYRPGSLCAIIQNILLVIEGEFNVHDIVSKCTEECVKLNEQPGNALRNSRLVITSMIKNGVLVKVSRGRWKRVQ